VQRSRRATTATDEAEADRRVVEVTSTEKRAAQVRVKADQRSHRETPAFIKAVAEAKPR